jgi:hypothetical protein
MQSVSPGLRAYLTYTEGIPLERAVKVQLDASAVKELTTMLLAMAEDIVETPLNTLKSGVTFF